MSLISDSNQNKHYIVPLEVSSRNPGSAGLTSNFYIELELVSISDIVNCSTLLLKSEFLGLLGIKRK